MGRYGLHRRALLAAMAAGISGASLLQSVMAEDAPLALTPQCRDVDELTPEETEGPFYTPDTPERRSLIEAGMAGRPIVFSGLVATPSCKPIAGALVDLWHADDRGEYDNKGFRLRGHQFTDAEGRFRFETIVPGLYPGRTRHFHVKYKAPGKSVLTTQHYFPNEPGNDRDGLFIPELLLTVAEKPKLAASFLVVLEG